MRKNVVANIIVLHLFTFSVVVVDLPTEWMLSFLFPTETDVLIPVFSQSTDVVVVNFVVILVPRATRLNLYHVTKTRRALGTRMVLSPQIVNFRFDCTVARKKAGEMLKTFSTPVLTNGFAFSSPAGP